MDALPERYQSGNAPVDLGPSVSATPSQDKSHVEAAASYPPEKTRQLQPQSTNAEYVEVLYNYAAQQPEDLSLTVGDKVQVLEHTSPDWWRGTCNGRTGMFPSNYVKPTFDARPAPSPAPSYSQMPPQQMQMQMPSQQYNNGYPVYPNNGTPFPPQGQDVQQQPQQQHHGGHLKKFGSKLGNAAIFGAGATIGSDIVNSIF